jgi:iron complex transport system ATP-binding protein
MRDASQQQSEAPLLEVRNASIFRGDTRVFCDFNLTIPQHQPVAILGPNGSGKTTLLKLMNRELYPVPDKASSVRILGRDRWNVWELRSRVGIVSHDLQASYRPGTTGLDVVLSGFLSSIGIHGLLRTRIGPEQRKRALVTLRELGAADLVEKPLAMMSTGQQRRCLLGRALVHDPDTLILDEPTTGLDLAATFDYQARIRRLARAGKNLVLVSHSLGEIPPEIDRVILLRQGKIVADGRKNEVLTTENLQLTYGVDVRIAVVDGYYLAYPAMAEKQDGAPGQR